MPGPPHPTQIEPLKRLTKIVNAFLSRDDIGPFREPVDWRGLGLDDYPKIVKKMMDLGTVKRKLERNQYFSATECANDIRLIWSNCMAYNADQSDFWLLAKSFQRRFEDRYRKIRQEMDCGADLKDGDESVPDAPPSSTSKSGSSAKDRSAPAAVPSSPDKPVPLDARARFGANLFLLSGVELAHVIMKLEQECPHVLEHLSDEVVTDETTPGAEPAFAPKLEINVDAIDAQLFTELSNFVEERVGSKGFTEPEEAPPRSKKKRR
ncbi:Bromodomain testis-specific protein [Seminavis robusta]|uniref:Bromodomain testis-specific protein n=1 Tax=Seminavis robusta TaxID=568900 RepID=A0A9N8EU12_9STRA|nr:Bromodomain testis-specific protein [Seminavis robusta]|eukprot:Sro1685_g291050.1 Bromodomain testis-specific protein (265) ;mRNA; f:7097-8076